MSRKDHLLRYAGNPWHAGGISFRRGLLGFEWLSDVWRAEVYRPFRPSGLIIWGAPAGAVVQQCIIGQDQQIQVSYAPAPARFFAMCDSYEQIAKLLDEGKEPPNWCDWDTVHPGCVVRISVEVPAENRNHQARILGPEQGLELCMWGNAMKVEPR